ncbi:hypothetical protein ACGFX4_10740 [Kitasatospora sp. NPDC048365]|uniref:hypothetical protein n=1 Tax=Kitasatospora sp. NPDC048365 TaxID=3364050 RepID=UPI003713190D
MTEAELVVAALAAGASAGVRETVSLAVRDTYEGLRDAVRRRLALRGGQAEEVLDTVETEPGVWEARLTAELSAAGIDRDPAVVEAARELLARLDESTSGKYAVDAREAKGVQVGDHGTQTNTFN